MTRNFHIQGVIVLEKTLGERLLCVAELIPECDSMVDCGCDHGHVSIYTAKHKNVGRITASDINRGPLDNAEREIAAARLSDRISTVLTNGLDGIEHHDCVVIAGMGAETIVDILSRANWTRDDCTLVLQPMTRAGILREYLYNEGFAITEEKFVREHGHLYCVIVAKHVGTYKAELFEKHISRAGLTSPLSDEYTDKIIARLTFEYEKKCAAGALSEDEKKKCEDEIASLTKMRESI